MQRYLDQIYEAAKEVRNITDELINFVEHKDGKNIHEIVLMQSICLARYRELTSPEIMIKLIELGRKQAQPKI